MLNRTMSSLASVRAHLAHFRRAEDGALIIFGLLFFVLMVMMGGFAVDLMRYENTRTNLQNTLDRSTLAAAAMSQRQDPETVVRDFMTKAGLEDQISTVTVTDVLNGRIVHAEGIADTHPIFLHMLGIDSFDATGLSQAEQAINNVEIVLVLDVSGSMGENHKIDNLKVAATNFVDTLLGNDPNHRVSITIVPYNAQVNIGPILVDKFNITHRNGVANDNCVELPADVYGSLALSRTEEMPMMAYADVTKNTNKTNGFVSPTDPNYARPDYSGSFCKPTTVNVIRLANNNQAILKQQINALQAGGNTSITLGMKWGMTLLDPSMRSMYDELIAAGQIPANLPERPFTYNDPKAMKIIVLMTDGEHVAHDRIVDAYKTGPSQIFKATTDGNYSVFFDGKINNASAATTCDSRPYWVPHLSAWQSRPWNGTAPAASDCFDANAGNSGVAEQDWRDIWANLKMTYVAWQFYARALGTDTNSRNAIYANTVSAMKQTYASVPGMDATLSTSCTQAKTNGVIVYGIAFEAPAHGQSVISSCASSASNYFAADGDEIKTAFDTIASNITMLKLTQ